MSATSVEARIVRHLVGTRYEDLPAAVVQATKDHLADTIGVAIGGSSAPGCKLLLDQLREWGGKEESSVLVYGGKLPDPSAALVNGTMGHARDFDDNHDTIAYKGSVAAVPAALAVAESLNINGRDLIAAVCLGIDLGCRLGLAIQPKPTHAFGRAIGCYGAAAAAGKAMALDDEQMHNALGLAHCEVGLGGISTAAPSLTKRLGVGIAARSGVWAAQLARRGYPASRDIFHGPSGYYALYEGQEGDLTELVDALGQRFEVVTLGMKPYPTCRYTHGSIDAAMQIMREHRLMPRDVGAVTVRMTQRDYVTVGGSGNKTREQALRRPASVVDAQFSAFYTVATAMVKGEVSLQHLSEGGLADPEVLAMADRVNTVADERLQVRDRDVQPQSVEIATRGGERYTKQVDYPKGSPQWPMSPLERTNKYWDCIDHAAVPIDRHRAEEALDIIGNLERLDKVSRLIAVLC
ncbi:MAG: MmgE/PrpD family protein [Burkholderiales bacterium]